MVARISALLLALSAAAAIAMLLQTPAHSSVTYVELSATHLASGESLGITVDGETLTLAPDAPSSPAYAPAPAFAVASSDPVPLAGGSSIRRVDLEAQVPDGAVVNVELRGQRRGHWTEWVAPDELPVLDGIDVLQCRLTLLPAANGEAARVSALRIETEPLEMRAFDASPSTAPTVRLWATRIGLVGQTTANGHVIRERDRFVALPSKRVLNVRGTTDYQVQLNYRGRTAIAPVWDIGPWNIQDDFWNEAREAFADLPRWTPQAEAAFFAGHNNGRDGYGRLVTIPTSIDLADGTYIEDLGLGNSDWIDVTFLWLNAPSPPPRPTRTVVPKTPLPTSPASGGLPGSREPSTERSASFNAALPATRVFLPTVREEPGSRSSAWTVQNASGAPASGLTELYDAAGTQVSALPFELPPWASATFRLGDFSGAPLPFNGSAVVSASAAVAVVVNEEQVGGDLRAYEGFPGGAPMVAAPLVYHQYRGWSTSLSVQNLGSLPSVVQLTYIAPSGATWTESTTVPPLAAVELSPTRSRTVPPDFVGSAWAQSMNDQPLAMVVAQQRQDGASMAYQGLSGGVERPGAPLLFKRYRGWDSGMQLTNLSPVGGTLVVRYQGTASVVESIPIAPFGSVSLYQPANAQLPHGFTGSATIQGPPGSRLVGIVNHTREGTRSAMTYGIGGAPGLAPVLAVPLVTSEAEGWTTGIQLQHPGGPPVDVQVRFYRETGELEYQADLALADGGIRTLFLPSIPQLGAGFRGSAVVQPLGGSVPTVIVNETVR